MSHHCTFDSNNDYVNEDGFQTLMCKCGRWGTLGGEEWQAIPRELLPWACRLGTWLHKLERVAYVIGAGMAVLALLWLVWG